MAKTVKNKKGVKKKADIAMNIREQLDKAYKKSAPTMIKFLDDLVADKLTEDQYDTKTGYIIQKRVAKSTMISGAKLLKEMTLDKLVANRKDAVIGEAKETLSDLIKQVDEARKAELKEVAAKSGGKVVALKPAKEA